MSRSARYKNESVENVFQEAERNLLAAFAKSSKTIHTGIKGNSRAQSVADFLAMRLPSKYGVRCNAEIVDYQDLHSRETDIVIFDKVRNAVLSDNPLWLPAESLLGCVEVKSILTKAHLSKSYIAAKKINLLKPFKRSFTLAEHRSDVSSLTSKVRNTKQPLSPFRCFRTIFAFNSDLNSPW